MSINLEASSMSLPLTYNLVEAAHICKIVWHQMANLAIGRIRIPAMSGK